MLQGERLGFKSSCDLLLLEMRLFVGKHSTYYLVLWKLRRANKLIISHARNALMVIPQNKNPWVKSRQRRSPGRNKEAFTGRVITRAPIMIDEERGRFITSNVTRTARAIFAYAQNELLLCPIRRCCLINLLFESDINRSKMISMK